VTANLAKDQERSLKESSLACPVKKSYVKNQNRMQE
jgi:hypothetical protein